MLSPILIEAIADELVKIASSKEEEEKILGKLKPGDILYTKLKNPKSEGMFSRAFYSVNSKVQGSPYTHVGLYDGKGGVIDSGATKAPRDSRMLGVRRIPLSKYLEKYHAKVLRVSATPAQRKNAVEYAEKQVGKNFNLKGMLRLVLPFKGNVEQKDRQKQETANEFFCSELVANAYGDLNIAKDKKLRHVRPGDIYKSPLTKVVADTE